MGEDLGSAAAALGHVVKLGANDRSMLWLPEGLPRRAMTPYSTKLLELPLRSGASKLCPKAIHVGSTDARGSRRNAHQHLDGLPVITLTGFSRRIGTGLGERDIAKILQKELALHLDR